MSTMAALRQTGRTTRMVAEAKRLASDGRAVYVVVANERERQRIAPMFDPGLGVKVETIYAFDSFDFENMRFRGAHPNCVVLVDHFVIEQQLSRVIEMLHRFDA